MSQITLEHAEALLQHWAYEHRRAAATYSAWQSNQVGGLVGQTVDRTREKEADVVRVLSPRARMARRLILKQMREMGEKFSIPTWAGGDPIRCKETRSGGAPRWQMDEVAETVDQWVIDLWRWDPRAAMCLHANFRHGMRTGEGARWVQKVTELRVNRHGYIAGLARGRLNIQRRAEEQVQIGA